MRMGVVSLEFSSMLDTFNRFRDVLHNVEVMEVFVMCVYMTCFACDTAFVGQISTLILAFLHVKQRYRCVFLNGYDYIWHINSLICCNVAMIWENFCVWEMSSLGSSLYAEHRCIHKRLKVMELYIAPNRTECKFLVGARSNCAYWLIGAESLRS
jgi:hypothetical protein